jgi:stearoyl-CoA desaturase (delta-9 desaturase)
MKTLKTESKIYYLLFNLPLQITCIISMFFITNIVTYFITFIVSYIIIYWLGIQAGSHKLFSHKTWTPKNDTIKYIIAIIGCFGLMGGPITWSQIHRHHHIYSDTDNDPHSPKNGRLHAYFLWLLDLPNFSLISVKDMLKDNILIKINNHCKMIVIVLLASIFLIDLNIFAGILLASVLTFHSEMFVNAFLHDNINGNWVAKNNTWLSYISGGSSLHENHHENPKLNNFALTRYQLDGSYWFIKLLSK